jgi:hypothetical protein
MRADLRCVFASDNAHDVNVDHAYSLGILHLSPVMVNISHGIRGRKSEAPPPVSPARDPARDPAPVAWAAGYGSFPQVFGFVPQMGISETASKNDTLVPSGSTLCTTNGATRMESLTNGT